jgi:hypothetical protein
MTSHPKSGVIRPEQCFKGRRKRTGARECASQMTTRIFEALGKKHPAGAPTIPAGNAAQTTEAEAW